MSRCKIMMILLCCVGLWACSAGNSHLAQKQATDDIDYEKAARLNAKMGLLYLENGQMARAKSKLIHAVELSPQLALVHSNLAYYWETVGDFSEAEKEYKTALRLSAGGKGPEYNNYGRFLCHAKRFEEADRIFLKSIEDKKYSNAAQVYENAGLCALQAGNRTRGEKYLEGAIRRDPFRTASLLELADIRVQQKKFEEAARLLQSYRDNEEPTSRSLWLTIQVARQLGDKDLWGSNALLLKNLFKDSPEYREYQASMKKKVG